MPALGPTRQPPRLVSKPQLNRIIPVAIHGFDLENMTRSGLNYRNRHHPSIGLKYLRHSDLAAEYTFSHGQIPSSLALRDSQIKSKQ
jgi:hypothetical protein